MDLQVEMSVPVGRGQTQAGPIFDLQRSRVDSTVVCPVGKTLILGGTRQLTESINVNSETPILGRIPLLQFFFSERGKMRRDRQVLVLVSPQLARAPEDSRPAVEQTQDTLKKSEEPLSILRNRRRQ